MPRPEIPGQTRAYFAVTARGTGRPDYSEEVALGRIRPGLTVKYTQTLKAFSIEFSDVASPYPFITTALAPGGTAHFVDWSTGLPMPYTIPAGYIWSAIQLGHSATEDYRFLGYLDTVYVGTLGYGGSGISNLFTHIVGFGTALFDPTAASSHLADVVMENLGLGNLQGVASIFAIEEAVGTPPPPTIKTVKCKHCGHETVVPVGTTSNICSECGQLTLYVDLANVRRL